MGACQTLDLSDPTPKSGLHIGVTQFKNIPAENGSFVKLSTFGSWAENSSSGLGYKSLEVAAIPQACKIVFLIHNMDQAKQAVDLIQSTLKDQEDDICILQKD